MRMLPSPLSIALAMVLMIGGHAYAGGRAVTIIPDPIERPSCATPPGAASRAFPDELPALVLKALNAKLGDVAAPGEPFDDTDVIITGRDRRAVFVWERGQSWVIATEHSKGWYYSNPVLRFDLSADGVNAALVRATTASPGTLCVIATGMLNLPPKVNLEWLPD